MLEAAGYPDQPGALTRVAKAQGIPPRTLSRWFNKEQNPPPDRMVIEKRGDLIDAIRDEIYAALGEMSAAREQANYRDLGIVAATFVDKLQLLEGKPTERTEVQVTDARDRLAHLVDQRATRLGTSGNPQRLN